MQQIHYYMAYHLINFTNLKTTIATTKSFFLLDALYQILLYNLFSFFSFLQVSLSHYHSSAQIRSNAFIIGSMRTCLVFIVDYVKGFVDYTVVLDDLIVHGIVVGQTVLIAEHSTRVHVGLQLFGTAIRPSELRGRF